VGKGVKLDAMWRWLKDRFRKVDYRPSGYSHKDLSPETSLPLAQQLKLLLIQRGSMGSPTDKPSFWFRHRKWITLVLALLAGWLIAESILAWNFFEVSN